MDIKFLRISSVEFTALQQPNTITFPYISDTFYRSVPRGMTDYIVSYDYRTEDDDVFKSDMITLQADLSAEDILTAIYAKIERRHMRDQEKKALQLRIQHLHDLKVYNDGINKKGKE